MHRPKEQCLPCGTGETSPQIHDLDYDFPDQIVAIGKLIVFEIRKNNFL
jgi:hypothetical protein